MFEKSLYDLIRGLRNHKGNERAYIQDSIRECRKEIKSQDMDLKATALLKLTYLEMFGHDMSWASFNALEVMSSPKYPQKKVGYLAAVQSFRPDTEVLMLAENLLKKDLGSPLVPTIALPLVAIPHVISPSMANSILSDLLPRLTHSNPSVRKKTIVTLYRLALVYPETLRPVWPKLKERLADDQEDPSVTAAIVNVVCELGWRRPQDFLPLAPRLFDLLIEGGNNWMAIKIIKLFATLTPLEPRLVKKLLPPLTTIIKTTPAMSLLYECVNGIIEGGVLASAAGTIEGDNVASMCVDKLRGMLVVQDDPNLKYVALLALQKIVQLHPYLVSLHEDVIMQCIDDPDISIRLRAIDLVTGMVNAQNLTSLVDRLMRQLDNSPQESLADDPFNDRAMHEGVMPSADSDDEDAEQSIRSREKKSQQAPPLPEDYRIGVISKILDMSSLNNYANINDFDWYIETLVSLIKHVPTQSQSLLPESQNASCINGDSDLALRIGSELRNIAVRVKSSRREATHAAELLVSSERQTLVFGSFGIGARSVLGPAVWVVGEFVSSLSDPRATLSSLLHPDTTRLPAHIMSAYIQAIIKLLTFAVSDDQSAWTDERKTDTTLLFARVINFLEPLTKNPGLEVQERAVEYLELIRLANEAVLAHSTSTDSNFVEPPLLLTQAMPSLFAGLELNPVARDAQRKVPIPDLLDLSTPINANLTALLTSTTSASSKEEDTTFHNYYHVKPIRKVIIESASQRLESSTPSYQQSSRLDRSDDPFYIPSRPRSPLSIKDTLNSIDIDSIPIMALDLPESTSISTPAVPRVQRAPTRRFEILADETLDAPSAAPAPVAAAKRSLLQVDSSGLGALSLGASGNAVQALDVERRAAEEAEMASAMKEVERLRLEMQRAQERVVATDGGAVRRKKGRRKEDGEEPKKKKKKKRREVVFEEGGPVVE